MTREEAIKVLSSYDVNGVWADVDGKPYSAEEQAEAFDMAIEALSAEAVPQSEQYKKGFEDAKRSFLVEYARESRNMRKRQLEVMLNAQKAISADRPRGEWIEINNGADTTCECSECHHKDYIPNVKTKQNKYECMDRYWFERNYCPNCGADMRGEDE